MYSIDPVSASDNDASALSFSEWVWLLQHSIEQQFCASWKMWLWNEPKRKMAKAAVEFNERSRDKEWIAEAERIEVLPFRVTKSIGECTYGYTNHTPVRCLSKPPANMPPPFLYATLCITTLFACIKSPTTIFSCASCEKPIDVDWWQCLISWNKIMLPNFLWNAFCELTKLSRDGTRSGFTRIHFLFSLVIHVYVLKLKRAKVRCIKESLERLVNDLSHKTSALSPSGSGPVEVILWTIKAVSNVEAKLVKQFASNLLKWHPSTFGKSLIHKPSTM